MHHQFDVVIVGGGPAGSIAAYNLAIKGINVLIIDKATFPRYKVCGGGIPYKAKDLLNPIFDIEHSAFSIQNSTLIYNFLFSCKYKTFYKRHSDKLLIHCFMRDEFDNYLLQNAVKAGTHLIEADKVKEVIENNYHVQVRTDKSEFTCRIVIGADGANSFVARSLNLMQKNVSKAYAIESEIYVNDKTLERYKETVGLDWGTLTNGYGWIFPKKDHLSVGVGGPITLSKYINSYYQNLIRKSDIQVIETKSYQGHIIPFRTNNNKIYTDSAILIGDAAGLTDPLTGEGIYYALKSGLIASEVIIDLFNNNISNLSAYQDKINQEIMSELNAALPIQYIFNIAPNYFHKLLRDNDRLWNAFCRILRGELSYTVVKSKLPASNIIWNPLIYSARFINDLKTR